MSKRSLDVSPNVHTQQQQHWNYDRFQTEIFQPLCATEELTTRYDDQLRDWMRRLTYEGEMKLQQNVTEEKMLQVIGRISRAKMCDVMSDHFIKKRNEHMEQQSKRARLDVAASAAVNSVNDEDDEDIPIARWIIPKAPRSLGPHIPLTDTRNVPVPMLGPLGPMAPTFSMPAAAAASSSAYAAAAAAAAAAAVPTISPAAVAVAAAVLDPSIKYSGLDCAVLRTGQFSSSEIQVKRQRIFARALVQANNDPMLTQMLDSVPLMSRLVKTFWDLYSEEYFGGGLAIPPHFQFAFRASPHMTSIGGHFSLRSDQMGTRAEIAISIPVLKKAFTGGIRSVRINGLLCFNRLECFQNVFEHELVHLLVHLVCQDHTDARKEHSQAFRDIVLHLFGHTDFRHAMHQDAEEYETKMAAVKAASMGQRVLLTLKQGTVVAGQIEKWNKKTAHVALDDGRKFKVSIGSLQMLD